MEVKYYTQPYDSNGNSFYLGFKINELLKSTKPQYNKIWLAASFAKKSGVSKLRQALKKAIKGGAQINFVLGTGKNLTSVEAVEELSNIGCNIKIYRTPQGSSFDAKVYCFEAEEKIAEVFMSSGNLTEGGLYKNHELIVNITYDLANGDQNLFEQFKQSVMPVLEPDSKYATELNKELMELLIEAGDLIYESETGGPAKAKKVVGENKKVEAVEEDIDLDKMLSIELPTGDSIEITLNSTESISDKIEHFNHTEEAKEKPKKSKKKKTEKEVVEEIDIQIEIEEPHNIEESVMLKNKEEVLKELYQDGYNQDEGSRGSAEKEEHKLVINNFDVIDIEDMLYHQSKNKEQEEPAPKSRKRGQKISEDGIDFIQSKPSKRASKKVKEEEIPVEKEPIRKKFLISSSLAKNSTGIINAFFIQINKLKGRGIAGEVKIPIAIRELSPEFWGWPKKYKLVETRGKSKKKCKKWTILCRIIDVTNPTNVQIDEAELFQVEGQTHFNFFSKLFVSLEPEENDIIRIIRCPETDECVFQCELIRAESQEYVIWDQFCSQTVKGTERRYGFS